jgi:superfamily II DNA or RNA helicase
MDQTAFLGARAGAARVVVDDRVRVRLADISDDAVLRLRADFTYENPEYKKRKAARIPLAGETREIATWSEDAGVMTFPRGGLSRVCDVLDAYGVDYEQVDARSVGDADLLFSHYDIPDLQGIELRPYQVAARDAVLKRENCIVHLGTGGGKTTIAMALIAAAKLPALVVVPDVGLLDQWYERVQRELGLRPDQIGRIGAGEWRVRPITIATDDTLHARPEAFEAIAGKFGVFVYDEVHGAAARTIFDVVDRSPSRFRVGFSNDSSRKDRKEFLVHDLFGAVAFEASARDLAAQGFILDVEVRVVPTDFDAPWYKAAFVDVARSRNRVRFASVQSRLIEEMTYDRARNELITDWVVREGGASAAVLSQRVEHAVELDRRIAATGVRTGFVLGGAGWKKQFGETIRGLRSGDVQVALGTIQAFGTGKDVPALANVFVVTPLANHKQGLAQVKGRACRLGKDSAHLYYFWDKRVSGKKAIENLVRWNKTVVVWSEGAWVNGRAYLREMRR